MTQCRALTIFELEELISLDEKSLGCCVGLVDQNCWKFLIYIGHGEFLIAYEKELGVIVEAFEYLKSNLDIFGENLNGLTTFHMDFYKNDRQDKEFYKYDMNIFQTINNNPKKKFEFIKTLEFNLNEIASLEEGDGIMFERGFYHHAAVLVDASKMLCAHRSGEPDDTDNFIVSSTSLLGIPTDKASVTLDHLIEIAGFSRLKKSNHIFDKNLTPKSKEEIVEIAKQRIGEIGYSVTTHNCQHFVSDCRNGTAVSPEVENIAKGAFYSGIFGMVSLLFAITSKYFLNSNKKAIQSKNNNA